MSMPCYLGLGTKVNIQSPNMRDISSETLGRLAIFFGNLGSNLAETNANFRTSLTDLNDALWIMINIPTPSQEPPATSKSRSHYLKDTDVLCTFKIKIKSQNLECWHIKDQ